MLGRLARRDREKAKRRLRWSAKPLAHRLVDSLSGGERQRAWIAMLVADSCCHVAR